MIPSRVEHSLRYPEYRLLNKHYNFLTDALTLMQKKSVAIKILLEDKTLPAGIATNAMVQKKAVEFFQSNRTLEAELVDAKTSLGDLDKNQQNNAVTYQALQLGISRIHAMEALLRVLIPFFPLPLKTEEPKDLLGKNIAAYAKEIRASVNTIDLAKEAITHVEGVCSQWLKADELRKTLSPEERSALDCQHIVQNNSGIMVDQVDHATTLLNQLTNFASLHIKPKIPLALTFMHEEEKTSIDINTCVKQLKACRETLADIERAAAKPDPRQWLQPFDDYLENHHAGLEKTFSALAKISQLPPGQRWRVCATDGRQGAWETLTFSADEHKRLTVLGGELLSQSKELVFSDKSSVLADMAHKDMAQHTPISKWADEVSAGRSATDALVRL